MKILQLGQDKYDGVSANGWFIVSGNVALAGPFVDAGAADRRMRRPRASWGEKVLVDSTQDAVQ